VQRKILCLGGFVTVVAVAASAFVFNPDIRCQTTIPIGVDAYANHIANEPAGLTYVYKYIVPGGQSIVPSYISTAYSNGKKPVLVLYTNYDSTSPNWTTWDATMNAVRQDGRDVDVVVEPDLFGYIRNQGGCGTTGRQMVDRFFYGAADAHWAPQPGLPYNASDAAGGRLLRRPATTACNIVDVTTACRIQGTYRRPQVKCTRTGSRPSQTTGRGKCLADTAETPSALAALDLCRELARSEQAPGAGALRRQAPVRSGHRRLRRREHSELEPAAAHQVRMRHVQLQSELPLQRLAPGPDGHTDYCADGNPHGGAAGYAHRRANRDSYSGAAGYADRRTDCNEDTRRDSHADPRIERPPR
jgi:hypothetical protein